MSPRSPTRFERLRTWLSPVAPGAIRAEVERRQLVSIRRQVPMIYGIASLNMLIAMAVCAHAGLEPRYYLWMLAFIVLALVRTVGWTRREHATLGPEAVSSALRWSTRIGTVSLLVLGAFASATFVSGLFHRSTLIPISLAFGSMSIAHCFAPVRPSAVAAIVLGILPSAVVMIALGDFEARVLGVSMVTVGVLMIRFVAGQFDHLVLEVELQREVYDLANTDALTGLFNRRALVALLEQKLPVRAEPFALALLDLDGFKGVNDRLGHLVGDELLRVVARRLTASCGPRASVGRLGGDEFVVVFHGAQGPADVDARVSAALAELCQPTVLANESVPVQASLGYALFPRDGETAPALLAVADASLYANKRARGTPPRLAPSDDPGDPGERRRHRTS